MRLGLPSSVVSADIPKILLDMIEASIGVSSVGQEVEVSGTVEMQDLHLLVLVKGSGETT